MKRENYLISIYQVHDQFYFFFVIGSNFTISSVDTMYFSHKKLSIVKYQLKQKIGDNDWKKNLLGNNNETRVLSYDRKKTSFFIRFFFVLLMLLLWFFTFDPMTVVFKTKIVKTATHEHEISNQWCTCGSSANRIKLHSWHI